MSKPPARIKLTEDHRAAFRAAVARWQLALNLGDWRINLSSRRATKDCLALVDKCSIPDRMATIRLADEWDENTPPTEDNFDWVALHEILHILLAELGAVKSNPAHTFDEHMAVEHRIINTMVRLLTGKA